MSDAKPGKLTRRKAKAAAALPLTLEEEAERAQLLADLAAEKYSASMAGLIERATVLLKDAAETLQETDSDDFRGQQDRETMRILVTYFEGWAAKRGISSVLDTLKFMADIIDFRNRLP